MIGVLTWVQRLTEGQVVELSRRVARTLTKSHDVDVPALREILEDFVRNLPKLALVLVLTAAAVDGASAQTVDTLWASWTWRNGNFAKVLSVGPPAPYFCDSTATRQVRFELQAGVRTTSLTLDACAAYGWQPVAFALESIADSGQIGPMWGPDGYRLQVLCRRRTVGCTLTLKRPLLWGSTVTFTLGPLPIAEVPKLRAAMVRATGAAPANAPAFPYTWRQEP